MDIPRGHAMLPLNESDFLDFIYNYFKAEYAPINSFWSTATAIPRQPTRWINMGHELAPFSIRPANAQAQKDLESLDYFVRKWNLDAGFVRGVVKRFASYEVHERLEKKLYECARLDLMVRKALKEKHLLDALWPSPAPRDLAQELLAQGVQVRRWYGDMFAKYFRALHAVDEFELRSEVDHYIKSRGTLMLIPFVDHLVFGNVEPIVPIVSRGAGFANAKPPRKNRTVGFGDPERFEIRFDSPTTVTETYSKSAVRQCQCMKCGTKRDVQIVVSVDPSPHSTPATDSRQSNKNTSARRLSQITQGQASAEAEIAPRPQSHETARPTTPEQKKQCPTCTFLNHPDLTTCEMCQAELPTTTVTKPLSPVPARTSHSHSLSLPSTSTSTDAAPTSSNTTARPGAPNRHSLSSTLFAIFPFSQQHQQEHHAKLPATQQTSTTIASGERSQPQDSASASASASASNAKHESASRDDIPREQQQASVPASAPQPLLNPSPSPSAHEATQSTTPPLSRAPEMAMMPLTPPHRPAPLGLPKSLMDDYVPVSPVPQSHDDEDAGWGEVSRAEAIKDDGDDDGDGGDGALVDLDAVAREEMGVWGERED
jgi:hypothetical protein